MAVGAQQVAGPLVKRKYRRRASAVFDPNGQGAVAPALGDNERDLMLEVDVLDA